MPVRSLAGKMRKLIEATGIGQQIPSSSYKAELERRGAEKLAKLGFPEHTPFVEFIPAVFTLQCHWWGEKSHWDIRIIDSGGVLWFGFETFSDPRLVTKDRPAKAQAKGLMAYFLYLAKMQSHFERKGVPRGENVPEGIANEMAWMWNQGSIPAGSTGNPTKDKPGGIVCVDKLKPAVLHRRSYDTIDVTYLGNVLKGRYLLRLIETPEGFRFSLRRFSAENQFPAQAMMEAAKGRPFSKLPSEHASLKDFLAAEHPTVTSSRKPSYPAILARRLTWLKV